MLTSIRISNIISKLITFVKALKNAKAISSANVLLLNTPEHGNLGDHAIAVAERSILNALLPSKQLLELTAPQLNLMIKLMRIMRRNKLIRLTVGSIHNPFHSPPPRTLQCFLFTGGAI